MFKSGFSIESLAAGSLTNFRQRVHPESHCEQFRRLQRDKEYVIGEGIDQLRRMRTVIFDTADPQAQQETLRAAHALADQMADYCLADSLDPTQPLSDHSYHGELAKCRAAFSDVEPQS